MHQPQFFAFAHSCARVGVGAGEGTAVGEGDGAAVGAGVGEGEGAPVGALVRGVGGGVVVHTARSDGCTLGSLISPSLSGAIQPPAATSSGKRLAAPTA
jgi:hypothetical protein